MNLRDYLHEKRFSKERMTLKKFAESIELSATHVGNYIYGRTRFSKKIARAIERITDGKVSAKEIMKDNPEKKNIYKKDSLK